MWCMMKDDKEFIAFWEKNRKHLISNAPKELRDQLVASTQLDSPIEWVFFAFPIFVGIAILPMIKLRSEILSWAVMVVVVIVLFVVMQLVKPYITKKRSTDQVVEAIKQYYYEVYKKSGDLHSLETWRL